jgi:IMP dehydrogenase/GMP reductase
MNRYLTFDDIGLIPKYNTIKSRQDTDISTTIDGLKYNFPFVPANMDTVISEKMADIITEKNGMLIYHRFCTIKEKLHIIKKYPNAYMSCGVNDMDEIKSLIDNGCNRFCIDVAHGHCKQVIDVIKFIKDLTKTNSIIAGNVCTYDGYVELGRAGASIIKCGIGGGCLGGNTRILLSNGTYKNISEIKINDEVINMEGKPVKVINVINKGIKNVIKIKNNLHYENTFVTEDHQFFIGDLSSSSKESISGSGIAKLLDQQAKTIPKTSKYKWKEIKDCNWDNTIAILPKNINWNLPVDFTIDLTKYLNRGDFTEDKITTNGGKDKITFNRYIKSSYELGYIFGTFLGDGCSRIYINPSNNTECGSIKWYFGYNEEHICKEVIRCIEQILSIKLEIKNEEKKSLKTITLYNKCLSHILFEFGKKTKKHLPQQYYCKNKDYIKGIFNGLIDSDGNLDNTKGCKRTIYCLENTSTQLIELFHWCCINLNMSYTTYGRKGRAGKLKGITEKSIFNTSYRSKTHTFNRFTKDYLYSNITSFDNTKIQMEVWDIEVDCPTHSFIANNMIVHNSVCTTRMKTGFGVPQFSAVLDCQKAKLDLEKEGIKTWLISDGGIKHPRDAVFAIAAGADMVMMGNLFAKTFESAGKKYIKNKDNHYELIDINNPPECDEIYSHYRGQASLHFMNSYYGTKKSATAEGVDFYTKCLGSTNDIINEYSGSLRSAMTYAGSDDLEKFRQNVEFFESTPNYMSESNARINQ